MRNLDWLITAAHCFKGERRQKRGWIVVVGRHSKFAKVAWDGRSAPMVRTPRNVFIHSRFGKKVSKEYDFAIIQLHQPVSL